MTTEPRCGALDPKGNACVLKSGHDKMHYAGSGFHWNGGERKASPAPKPKKKPTAPCADTMAGYTCKLLKGHDGDHVADGGQLSRDRKSARFDCSPDRDERESQPDIEVHVCAETSSDVDLSKATISIDDKIDQLYALILAEPGIPTEHLPRGFAKAVKTLEADGRIELRDKGWHSTAITAPEALKPMTLDDEPEDPEGDEIALAAMDAADEEIAAMEAQNAEQKRKIAERDAVFFGAEALRASGIEVAPAPSRKPHVDGPPAQRIGGHEVHPAAALFPLIEGDEYQAFLDNLRANGQRRAIVRIDGRILDGRNRLRGVLELGLTPRFREFGSDPGDGTDPIAFVISENIARRHLNETQRAFVGAELVPMYEAQARERMLAGKNPSPNSGQGETGKATVLAAKAVNVGKTSIEAALKVKADGAPEVLAAARDRGQIKVSTAAELVNLPKQKQQEIVQKIGGGELRSGKVRAYVNQEKKRAVVRKINEQRVAPMPIGPFGVIYGDYPWHYDNSDQHEGSRGHLPYPPMKMDEVLAHAAEAAKRADVRCILALWATNLIVTDMGPVLRAYGVGPRRTVFTWPKPKFGVGSLGRGQTEHLVIACIGEPVHTLNEVSTLLPSWAPEHPGEHSSKPAEVRDLLRKHCGGPFLELFAREQHDGWASWGAETDKFSTEAA